VEPEAAMTTFAVSDAYRYFDVTKLVHKEYLIPTDNITMLD